MKRALMKRALIRSFVLFTTTLVAAAAAHPAGAYVPQEDKGARGRLRLESLERLAPKAAESVNIEIDGFLINFAGSLLSEDDADERAVKELVAGLKGIYVKRYEFKADGQFAESDVAAVREQLRAPLWSRLVEVESRGADFGNAEVYVASDAGRVEGLALLVVQPRELTVINIVGAVDIAKLQKLTGTLRLPRINIKRKRSDK